MINKIKRIAYHYLQYPKAKTGQIFFRHDNHIYAEKLLEIAKNANNIEKFLNDVNDVRISIPEHFTGPGKLKSQLNIFFHNLGAHAPASAFSAFEVNELSYLYNDEFNHNVLNIIKRYRDEYFKETLESTTSLYFNELPLEQICRF